MLNSLQACRALAAILVVLHHANYSIFRLEKYFHYEPTGRLFSFAYASVDLFYVLCGFIMLHVHAKDLGKPREVGPYLWKRFARIYLFYWVVLAVVLVIYFLVPSFGVGFERDPDVIVRSILLVPHPDFHMVFGVAWTLVYEVLFYLLFGLLIISKRIGTGVFVVWACFVLAYTQFEHHPWCFLFSHHYMRFFAGMLVWMVLQRWRIPAPRVVAGVGGAMFLASGLLEAYGGPLSALPQITLFTVSSAIALVGLVEADRSGLLHPPRWLVYIGDATYAIYLVHFIALSATAKIAKSLALDQYLPSLALYGLHVVIALGFGCLCHQVIEHPLHRWSKRFFRRGERGPFVIAMKVSAPVSPALERSEAPTPEKSEAA